MSQAVTLILYRHHKGIVMELERLPAIEPQTEAVLQKYRESVALLEKKLGKQKGASE